jgi:hypothetical protein
LRPARNNPSVGAAGSRRGSGEWVSASCMSTRSGKI